MSLCAMHIRIWKYKNKYTVQPTIFAHIVWYLMYIRTEIQSTQKSSVVCLKKYILYFTYFFFSLYSKYKYVSANL